MTEQEIEPYEDTLTLEELRRELRREWDDVHALMKALRDAPEVAPYCVLRMLSEAAKHPEDWSRGKQMQREHGLDAVWAKSEIESGAGLWWRIRQGLLNQGDMPEQKGAAL